MGKSHRAGGRKLSPKARSSFYTHARFYAKDAAAIGKANRVMRESERRARYGDPDFEGPPPTPVSREPVAFEPDEADQEIPAHKRWKR